MKKWVKGLLFIILSLIMILGLLGFVVFCFENHVFILKILIGLFVLSALYDFLKITYKMGKDVIK